jgi:hypothetical protein
MTRRSAGDGSEVMGIDGSPLLNLTAFLVLPSSLLLPSGVIQL